MEVLFAEIKETKGTHMFLEVNEERQTKVLRNIYVTKAALKELGWKPGKILKVSVSLLQS